ncbi:MAG: hypothetical protein RLN60_00905 [Phycisphaerales bacterium]
MSADASVTLRALKGTPLRHAGVREMVVSSAHAIAERNGLALVSVEAGDDRVTITLAEGQVAALGLASELRRVTDAWYRKKYGGASLWGRLPGEADRDDDDDDDEDDAYDGG